MFEYKISKIPFDSEEEMALSLNELGKDRWELVQVIGTRFFFKREVKNST